MNFFTFIMATLCITMALFTAENFAQSNHLSRTHAKSSTDLNDLQKLHNYSLDKDAKLTLEDCEKLSNKVDRIKCMAFHQR